MTGVVVLPNYNDWTSLAVLTEELQEVFGTLPGTWRVLVVDDASVIPCPQGWNPPGVHCIRLVANQGHQAAIFYGLKWVRENWPDVDHVVVMDADGEDDPHALPALLDREEEVVFAQRGKRHEGWRFQLGYQLYRALFRAVTGQRMRVGNYAVVRKEVLQALSDSGFAHFGAALLNWTGTKAFVTVHRRPRIDGQSSMNAQRLMYHGLRSLVENMEALVHWMFRMFVGVILGIAALGSYALVSKFLLRNAVPGWTSVLGVGLCIAALVVFVGFVLGLVALNLRWQYGVTSRQHAWVDHRLGEGKTGEVD